MTRTIDFMKARALRLIISGVLIVGGIVGTIVAGGFNLGIDFRAGVSVTVDVSSAPAIEEVRASVASIESAQVQRLGEEGSGQFIVRVRDDGTVDSFESVTTEWVIDALGTAFPGSTVEELEVIYVGPRFSADLASQTVTLTLFAVVLILAYLWFRFRLAYAVASIVALLHDVVVILGVVGALGLEVSTATIAAVLTIIGYSLNDTIVIFDRIRENEEILRDRPLNDIVNVSITQSLGRTLITSLTTLLAVGAIMVIATGAIQLFATKLFIGVVVGTYSSVFVASPVFTQLQRRQSARRRQKETEAYRKGAVAKSGGEATGKSVAAANAGPDLEAARREVQQQRRKKQNRS